ncbi:MAG TPA: hypothetical protein VF350_00160 [Candidatus Bathyarchaeia archaeon]
MSESKPLRCHKCGKPIGYAKVTTQSFLAAKSSLDNAKLIVTCIDCSNTNSFYRRNF